MDMDSETYLQILKRGCISTVSGYNWDNLPEYDCEYEWECGDCPIVIEKYREHSADGCELFNYV